MVAETINSSSHSAKKLLLCDGTYCFVPLKKLRSGWQSVNNRYKLGQSMKTICIVPIQFIPSVVKSLFSIKEILRRFFEIFNRDFQC